MTPSPETQKRPIPLLQFDGHRGKPYTVVFETEDGHAFKHQFYGNQICFVADEEEECVILVPGFIKVLQRESFLYFFYSIKYVKQESWIPQEARIRRNSKLWLGSPIHQPNDDITFVPPVF